MGYYSTLSFEGKATKINKKALENLNQILKEGKIEGFEGVKILFDKNGHLDIEMEDYLRKFYPR